LFTTCRLFSAMASIRSNTYNGHCILALLFLVASVAHCVSTTREDTQFEVLQVITHDTNAFTQGLTYDVGSGKLYESTGLYGESDLREIDPISGEVIKIVNMDRQYFAEGMTLFETESGEKRLIQITWNEKTGFIYSADTLERLETFSYETSNGQGWGITYNAAEKEFIVSDGSNWLHFWDRDTLTEKRRISVELALAETKSGNPKPLLTESVDRLNELEFVVEKGEAYVLANRWRDNDIYKINAQTGIIARIYDMSDLRNSLPRKGVLNGISITAEEGIYYITGKKWSTMYVIRLY